MIKTFILAGALLLAPIQKADEVENPPITEVVEDNTYTYENEDGGKATLILLNESEFTITLITLDGERIEGQGHYTRDGNILTLSVNGDELKVEINDELKTFDYYEAPNEENDEIVEDDEEKLIDKIKEEIDKILNTKLFGSMTFGAVCACIVTMLFNLWKSQTLNKLTKRNIKAGNDSIEASKTNNAELIKKIDELNAKIEELNKENEEHKQELAKFEDSVSNLALIERKIDILLNNQQLLSANDDNLVSKGIAAQIDKSIKEIEGDENEK